MNNHFIYARTAAGEAAVHATSTASSLSVRDRRFLELIDGQRSVAELSTVARPAELSNILEQLASAGLIAKIGETHIHISDLMLSADSDDPFGVVALTPEMFEKTRAQVVQDLQQRISGLFDPIVQEIQTSETPEALRATLRRAEPMIANVLGEEATRRLLQHIGHRLI